MWPCIATRLTRMATAAIAAGIARCGKDTFETPAQSQQNPADGRPQNTAQAADPKHPTHAGSAGQRGVAARGVGIQAGLRATHEETDERDDHCKLERLDAAQAEHHEQPAAHEVECGDDGVGTPAIHQQPDQDRAHGAAKLEHRRYVRRAIDRQAGVPHHRRQPACGQVDDQQAHEVGDPQGKRARGERPVNSTAIGWRAWVASSCSVMR